LLDFGSIAGFQARSHERRDGRTMLVIGLISGTSADGVDAAIVEINGAPPQLSVALRSFTFVPYSAKQRQQIFSLFDPQTSRVDQICQMNFAVGEWFASAALQAVRASGLSFEHIDLIGSHGQTIYHCMEPDTPVRSTLQIGEPAVIAERTGITVVADFRVADVAAGGQGAPLVSYVDWLLYRHSAKRRSLQNIGGIGNVTYLPMDQAPEQVLSFDTGPGNMLIDYAVQRLTAGNQTFDDGGRLAAQGQVSQTLLAELMSHPYFDQPLPKTTGREQFGVFFGEQVWERGQAMGLNGLDLLATLTVFTAASIADSYRRFLPEMPDEIIVGGGGANNPVLLQMLRDELYPIPVLRQEDLGYSSDAKEAVAFAVIAYETLHGRPGNLPSCTFALHPAVLGKIVPGKNFPSLLFCAR
jgi:anhydro-N-acetylmuramic acid kinase